MLFPYRYLKGHPIEQLQEWLDHLVTEVWCKADGDYDISKLDGCPELRAVVEEIFYDDNITKDHLYGPIKEVYEIFQAFDGDLKKKMRQWYLNNNDIEKLCSGKADCIPLTYKELKRHHGKLSDILSAFYKNMFNNVLKLKAVWSKIGKMEEHYKDFVEDNDEDICPFCGVNSIKGQYHSKREAYDHFLPKDVYPFNSVNFYNLAPMCHECNSSYKLIKDPLYKPKHRDPLFDREDRRRKAFYPYGENKPDINLKVEVKTKDIDRLKPTELTIDITSEKFDEELNSWKDVFGIDERYKAICCSKNDGKYWFMQMVDELDEFDDPNDRASCLSDEMRKLARRAKKYPWADKNFLKLPFLEGCDEAGAIG